MNATELKTEIIKQVQKHPECKIPNFEMFNIDIRKYERKKDECIGFGCEFDNFSLYHWTSYFDLDGYIIKSNISYAGMIMIHHIIHSYD